MVYVAERDENEYARWILCEQQTMETALASFERVVTCRGTHNVKLLVEVTMTVTVDATPTHPETWTHFLPPQEGEV